MFTQIIKHETKEQSYSVIYTFEGINANNVHGEREDYCVILCYN